MNVGFYHVDRGTREHRELARKMVLSVRRTLPDCTITQFTQTDQPFTIIAGVDRAMSVATAPLALAVLDAYASVDGPWLFLDTDVLVQDGAAVHSVFEDSFDIAVATREGTLLEKETGTKFMAAMPYNKGAVFSTSRAFWQAAAAHLRELPAKRQEWMGDQVAMNAIIAGGAFAVKVLDARFNYPPKSRTEDVRDRAILHFKGPRKAWMREHAA